jgi:hypothetical protein
MVALGRMLTSVGFRWGMSPDSQPALHGPSPCANRCCEAKLLLGGPIGI